MEITKVSPQWEVSSNFRMTDVGGKPITARRALAQGQAFLAPDAFAALERGTNPKGDVLALAEVAGIMAAKRTSDSIPLCHPLPLQAVRVSFKLEAKTCSVTAFCEASTHGQTGVEMEALAGVNGALLTVYDLSKAVNPEITLSGIHLCLKEGGKSGIWRHPSYIGENLAVKSTDNRDCDQELLGVRTGVITISDRVSAAQAQDRSGPKICELLTAQGAALVPARVVPDEQDAIQRAIHCMIGEGARLVITTGGTGLSPRDVTPEAVTAIAQRIIPGIGECLRQDGARHVRTAWLSRSLGAVVEGALVIALPGSYNAVSEGITALLPILGHALHTMEGGSHDSIR